MEAQSTLLAHTNSDTVTREQLAKIEVTEAVTPHFRPIKHIDLVENLTRAIQSFGMRIEKEQLAVRRDGQMLFGVMNVAYRGESEFVTSLGFRHANDRSMSIQLVSGISVFVCDNMTFSGDSIVLRQKHSHSFSLTVQLDKALEKWRDRSDALIQDVADLRSHRLTNIEAKALTLDAFTQGIMPLRFMPDVVKEWNEPRHEQFRNRTMWSLHNAFTEVQKQMPLTTRMAAAQDLGRLFRERIND